MDAIFKALGIDWTLWVQLGIFLVAFLSLSNFVFKPYMAAYEERRRRTTGSLESAGELEKETEALQTKYEAQARALSAEIKTIMDQARLEGQNTQAEIVDRARGEAEGELRTARAQLETQIKDARARLKQDVGELSQVITNKLLNRAGS